MSNTNDNLCDTLESYGLLMHRKNHQDVYEVFDDLKDRLRKFVRQVPNGDGTSGGATIETTGDFDLWCSVPGQTTDAVVVVPGFVTDRDIQVDFKKYMDKYMDMTTRRASSATPEFNVQIKNMKFRLIVVRVNVSHVPVIFNISCETFTDIIDKKHFASLRDARIADSIRHIVPVRLFSIVYQAVTLYAKINGIFSSQTGFLGENGWRCLVAYVCIQHSERSAPTVLMKVFDTLNTWSWPEPMVLENDSTTRRNSLNAQSWKPGDGESCLPIITPCFPQTLATPEVTKNSLGILMYHASRAFDICEKVMAGTALWDALFAPSDEFEGFEKFLVFVVSSPTEEELVAANQMMIDHMNELVHRLKANSSIEFYHAFDIAYQPSRPKSLEVEIGKANIMVVGIIGSPIQALKIDKDVDIFVTNMRWRLQSLQSELKIHIVDDSDLDMFVFNSKHRANLKAQEENRKKKKAAVQELERLESERKKVEARLAEEKRNYLTLKGRVLGTKRRLESETVQGQPVTGPAPKMTVEGIKEFLNKKDVQAKELSTTLAIPIKKLIAFKKGTVQPNEKEHMLLSEFGNSVGSTIQKGKQRLSRQATELLQPYVFSTDPLTTERLTAISNLVAAKTGETIELVQLRKWIKNRKHNAKKTGLQL